VYVLQCTDDYRGTTFSIGICSIDPDQKDVVEDRVSETETRGQRDDRDICDEMGRITDSSNPFDFLTLLAIVLRTFVFARSNSPSSCSGEQKEYNSRYPPSEQNTSLKSLVVD
jgi:hypothetical protein